MRDAKKVVIRWSNIDGMDRGREWSKFVKYIIGLTVVTVLDVTASVANAQQCYTSQSWISRSGADGDSDADQQPLDNEHSSTPDD